MSPRKDSKGEVREARGREQEGRAGGRRAAVDSTPSRGERGRCSQEKISNPRKSATSSCLHGDGDGEDIRGGGEERLHLSRNRGAVNPEKCFWGVTADRSFDTSSF